MKVICISHGRRYGQAAVDRRNRLILAHTYLVTPIAKHIGKRLPACFDLADLIDAGTQGLMRAAETYSPKDHGDTPFTAYARMKIRGEIIENVRRRHWKETVHPGLYFRETSGTKESDTIRVPQHLIEEPRLNPETDQAIDLERRRAVIEEALNWLPELERRIIRGYYWDGRTLGQIAEELELNETRVAAVRNAALQELNRRLTWRGLKSAA